MLNSFVVLLTLILLHAADITKCTKDQITQINFGKLESEVATFCYNQDKTLLVSKSCLQKKCLAFAQKRKFKFKELLSPVGKPGFKLCRELGGTPELIKFYVESKAYDLDRCLFPDKGFADTGYLMSYYLD